MPLIKAWNITLEADQVLRAQGADPKVIRERRPALADSRMGSKEGLPLLNLRPCILSCRCVSCATSGFPGCTGTNGKKVFQAPCLPAIWFSRVAIAVCTIGEDVEGSDVSMTG
jgi:hypothetical protein